METVQAKHAVGDAIHVKLFYADDRASFKHYGVVLDSRLNRGSGTFRDTILYDLSLEQTDAPPIEIKNLRQGFVMAGGPELEDNEE